MNYLSKTIFIQVNSILSLATKHSLYSVLYTVSSVVSVTCDTSVYYNLLYRIYNSHSKNFAGIFCLYVHNFEFKQYVIRNYSLFRAL